jgi:hypothetical protein
MPYFSPRNPPLFSATLPPIVLIFIEPGSGGYSSPCASARSDTFCVITPPPRAREILFVEFEDAIHLREAKNDAPRHRHTAAAEAGAAPAPHDGDVMLRRVAHNRLRLRRGLGKHHHRADSAQRRRPIVPIREQILARMQHAWRIEKSGQIGNQIRHAMRSRERSPVGKRKKEPWNRKREFDIGLASPTAVILHAPEAHSG